MKLDPYQLSLLGELTDSEFDTFKSCIKILLSRSFIIRGIEKEERLYEFAIRNISLLETWFSCADIELKKDEGLGVIACRSSADMRVNLNREDTCILLIFRILYEEHRGELRLSTFPSVQVGEFLRRLQSIANIQPKKTRIAETFRRFSFFRLIQVIGDSSDPEATIVLLPSLALALDQQAIEEIEQGIKTEESLSEKGSDIIELEEDDIQMDTEDEL